MQIAERMKSIPFTPISASAYLFCSDGFSVPESTTTRTAGGLDFAAIGGKRQGREVPQSLKTTRVEPGACQ